MCFNADTNGDGKADNLNDVIGEDVNGDGIIDGPNDGGADLNNDGDRSDWFGIDESVQCKDGILWDDDLKQEVDKISSSAKVILIFDTCFSGGFIQEMSGSNRVVMSGVDENHYGWTLTSDGTELGVAFTYFFLNALNNKVNIVEWAFEDANNEIEKMVGPNGLGSLPVISDQIAGEVILTIS